MGESLSTGSMKNNDHALASDVGTVCRAKDKKLCLLSLVAIIIRLLAGQLQSFRSV